jgi:hypothetical protein
VAHALVAPGARLAVARWFLHVAVGRPVPQDLPAILTPYDIWANMASIVVMTSSAVRPDATTLGLASTASYHANTNDKPASSHIARTSTWGTKCGRTEYPNTNEASAASPNEKSPRRNGESPGRSRVVPRAQNKQRSDNMLG